jgi:hypothetical protein
MTVSKLRYRVGDRVIIRYGVDLRGIAISTEPSLLYDKVGVILGIDLIPDWSIKSLNHQPAYDIEASGTVWWYPESYLEPIQVDLLDNLFQEGA